MADPMQPEVADIHILVSQIVTGTEHDDTDMRAVMGRDDLLNVSLGIANRDQRLSLRKLRGVVVCHLYE